ncbi:MAG: 50S ribosomal protein L1 [Proteobacteria bacterium]|nr:50S ribosomal protein L1 [Pseudomonadota bacterium]
MVKKTKYHKSIENKVDVEKSYDLVEGIDLILELAKAKFDESIEIALNLGVDPRHADQQVRGSVPLAHGTGKTVRVAVFAKGEQAVEAQEAGADVVGFEDLVQKVQKGFLEFDRVVATPDCMSELSKVARILGPKGLMPNPKLGTVTKDVAEAVKKIKAGMVQYRVDKSGIVHAQVAKVSFGKVKIVENVREFANAIKVAKPKGVKGTFMKSATLCSTMGPGVKIDIVSLTK